ncbi:MAG: hypothetical protein ACJA1L_001388 [Paracoccaceae bacterium]|jgi:hypothetical protein
MLTRSALILAATLTLPIQTAQALTCAPPEDAAAAAATQAEATVLGRAVIAPAPPAPPPVPAPTAPAEGEMLALFLPMPTFTDRDVAIEVIEVIAGQAPAALNARFRTGPCVTFAPGGGPQTLFLAREGDGWRLLGGR